MLDSTVEPNFGSENCCVQTCYRFPVVEMNVPNNIFKHFVGALIHQRHKESYICFMCLHLAWRFLVPLPSSRLLMSFELSINSNLLSCNSHTANDVELEWYQSVLKNIYERDMGIFGCSFASIPRWHYSCLSLLKAKPTVGQTDCGKGI